MAPVGAARKIYTGLWGRGGSECILENMGGKAWT
jgi:hypothetical protein